MKLPKCPYLVRKGDIKEAIDYFKKDKLIGYARVVSIHENKLFDGVIIFEKGRIVLSYLSQGNKEFFGDSALKKIIDIGENFTVECFEMDVEKLELLKKYYPEARVTRKLEIPQALPSLEKKELSREELLKKYKIRVPTEQEISTIILNFFEINNLENDVKEDIKRELSPFVEKMDINLLSHGYFLECDGKVIVPYQNKNKVEMIKEKIENCLNKLSNKLGIEVKNSVDILIGGN